MRPNGAAARLSAGAVDVVLASPQVELQLTSFGPCERYLTLVVCFECDCMLCYRPMGFEA